MITIRALIARPTVEGWLSTRIVPFVEVGEWALLGWIFVGRDPHDEDRYVEETLRVGPQGPRRESRHRSR